MYKQIKSLCALPPNSKRPNDRWSILHAVMKRENGLAGYRAGAFTASQERRIANWFVPNTKVERLMALDSKIYVCKFNNDGSRLVTASQNGLLRIFDSSKSTYHRTKVMNLRDVTWAILDVDFSPCGRHFAYSTWSDSCKL